MKRGIIMWIAMSAVVLTSCMREEITSQGGEGKILNLRLEVDDILTGLEAPTRATIPAEEGETTINSLYLFFYENKSDGSGAWVKTFTEDDLGSAPAMNGNYAIDFGANGLDENASYTILALANLGTTATDPNGYLNGESEAGFTTLLQDLTEKQAIERTSVVVSGVDIVETDDSRAIKSDNLLMCARAVYQAGDNTVLVNLIRGVSRFDVYLHETAVMPGFKLKSASVWGAAMQESVWYDRVVDSPARTQRFYGLKNDAGFTDGKIVGGLYAPENFVSQPEINDRVTTCVIIGLECTAANSFGGEIGKTYYYRINVNPMSSPQDLRRNHVYKIRVNSVGSLGEDNEYNAWSQSKIVLDVSINEWNVDENSMVITDGVNTMVLPVKLVRLDPRGEVREFSIFTIGAGELTISKNSLPSDGTIEASLSGSLLQVTAEPLPRDGEERRGSIEISYGALRGAISFIQSPDQSVFLTLNRYEIPSYAPTGRTGTSDNVPFEVTSSGPWTATIYNMTDDADNPGFSFNLSGEPVTTLRSSQNALGNIFQIYTTGDNTSNSDVRNGFVEITLDEDPTKYSRVVVLEQDPKSEIVLNPVMPSPLRFSPAGLPMGMNGATPDGGFIFDINPGRSSGGVLNTWSVTPSSGDTEYFEIEEVEAGSVNRLIVRAKGTDAGYPHMNLSENPLTATFTITAGTASREFIVTQGVMSISVSTQGTQIDKKGGVIRDVTVNIDPSLQWQATIVDNYTAQNGDIAHIQHDGYLVVGGANVGTMTNPQPQSVKLSAGFDKIYYPLVNESPRMTIRVSLAENPDVYTDFTVTQSPLTPAPMNILDVRNSGWGSLTGGDHYLSYYRSYLGNTSMFGPNGRVKTGTPLRITGQSGDPAQISADYVYLHAGGRPGDQWSQARHTAVNEWWSRNGKEGILYYFNEPNNNDLFANANTSKKTTVLSMLGIQGRGHTSGMGDMVLNTDVSNTAVYRYLIQYGPFGASGTFGPVYMDGINTQVFATSLPDNAVPLIVDENNHNNVLLFVDPENNIIYQGESQIFDTYIESASITLRGGSYHTYANLSRFMANLQAYVLNAAQYGSHYTELFLPGHEAQFNDAFVNGQ